MYSVVSVWNVEKGREEEQRRGLEQADVEFRPGSGAVSSAFAGVYSAGYAVGLIYEAFFSSHQANNQHRIEIAPAPCGRRRF